MAEEYQNVMIGSGEAGKFLAWTLARQGQKSLVVEGGWLVAGGAARMSPAYPARTSLTAPRSPLS